METYNERILRYRVVRCQHMDRRRVAEYRLHGIEVPEDEISRELVWSFNDKDAAEQTQREENVDAVERGWSVWYEVVDAGQETVIERQAWF